jgi:microcystin-dependent protein
MSEPFLAEVRIFGFTFAPRGWALCDGQILPINQNESLYSLLGTTYGGDGRTSFALPDLRGRTPIHEGNGYSLGQKAGAETVSLTQDHMPAHSHRVRASIEAGDRGVPIGAVLAAPSIDPVYADPGNLVDMSSDALGSAGGQAHNNMQPYLAVNFAIALQGTFPSSN